MMSAERTVLVDMDGVIAAFDDGVNKRVSARLPDVIPRQRDSFYIADAYGAHAGVVRTIPLEPGFFEELDVMPNALEGWQRIIDQGFMPRICSSPIRANPTCAAEKRAWLMKHFVPEFGLGVVEDAIITTTKFRVPGIALIDDHPEPKSEAEAVWQHVIFDHEFNRDVAKPRLHGWLDPAMPAILNAAFEAYRPKELALPELY